MTTGQLPAFDPHAVIWTGSRHGPQEHGWLARSLGREYALTEFLQEPSPLDPGARRSLGQQLAPGAPRRHAAEIHASDRQFAVEHTPAQLSGGNCQLTVQLVPVVAQARCSE